MKTQSHTPNLCELGANTFLKLSLFAGVLAALGGSFAQTVKADSFTLQGGIHAQRTGDA